MKSEDLKKQQKFMMVLPLLALPFLTIGFMALGGGSGEAKETATEKAKGLAAEIPGAHLDNKKMDKLSYYEAAQSDSSKLSEMMKNDPYYKHDVSQMPQQQAIPGMPAYGFPGYTNPSPGYGTAYPGSGEAGVYQRLNALNNALNAPPQPAVPTAPVSGTSESVGTADVDRLENMMRMMQDGSGNAQDPELKQLSGMLENILDIQHPERIQEKLRKTSAENTGQVFSVSAGKPQDPVSVLVSTKNTKNDNNGFFGLTDPTVMAEEDNSIQAVVHQTQTLVDGSIVKLRLLTDVYINGALIPKDQFIYGLASLNGERLTITVESLRSGQALYTVKLAVYDLDGLNGIHIPGAISRDVAKQTGTNSLQGLSMTSLDPSIGMQAASAGIELSKNLLSKKVRQVKVTVKAGYLVLLKDENKKNK